MRPQLIAAFLAVFGVGLGAGLLLFSSCGQASPVTIRFTDPPQGLRTGSLIRIYITGAVPNPGVYSLRDGDRVVDAVEAAGGPAPDADTEAVNFAQRLRDELHLHIPRVGETAEAIEPQSMDTLAAPATQLVDINRADANLLRSLPGIGATRADNIVASRQKDGPFRSIDDLIRRQLLPQSVYDQVKSLIQVAP